MAHVFVSYSRADRDRVRRIVDGLEKNGWSVWWDPEIMPGERYAQTIDAELKAAKCVLAVWSEHSANSDWVQEEAEDGKARGVLLPVLIDDIPIPRGFRRIQTVDLSDWSGDPKHPGWIYVTAAAKRFVEGGPVPPIPLPKTRRQKRAALIANMVSAAALIVIAGGVWWGAMHPAEVQAITHNTFVTQIVNFFTGGGGETRSAEAGGARTAASGAGEPNDSIDAAGALAIDSAVAGEIAENDVDFYRTQAPQGFRNMVRFRLDADAPLSPSLQIFNGRQEEIVHRYLGTAGGVVEAVVPAQAGETLYARVDGFGGGPTGPYRLEIGADTAHPAAARYPGAASEREGNDTIFDAAEIAWGAPLLGFLAQGDKDYFRIVAPAGVGGEAAISVRAAAPTIRPSLYVFDADQNRIAYEYTTTEGGGVTARFAAAPGAAYFLGVENFSVGFGDYVIEFAAAP